MKKLIKQSSIISSVCISVILFFTIDIGLVPAAEFDAEKLAAIRTKMQKFVDEQGSNQVAGLVMVVGSSKGIAALEAIGQQNIEEKKPMLKNGLFRIASMTKPVTSIGIMILQDDGKLSVEDPVEKYLPEFKGQMLLESREGSKVILKKPERPITIRDLLTHTSGLPGGFPPGLADLYFKRNYSLAEATMIQSQRPLDFPPGSKWSYCNAGMDTLGRIIEVVSGMSYEDFLKKRIFKPLGMKQTSPYPTDKQLKRLAGLYNFKDGKLNYLGFQLLGPTKGARHPIPAGGLYSTGSDLAKIYQMMLNQGKAGDKQILSRAAVKQMTTLQTGDIQCGFTNGMGFGFGWGVVKQPQGVHEMMSAGTYGHGGAFGTQAWIDPQKDLFIILLIQRVGIPNADASDLRRTLQIGAVEALKK
ncbi:MAG: serine hydrolase [Kiritimatiellae bacterium]|nr:serine hydrolase [Kiritimatiellia bacterium]MDD5519296.1 serine hydrolase [Kiritimatiellia bacterium]